MKLPQLYDVFRERWEQFGTAYLISDTHFGDKDLQANIKNRPNDEDYVKIINSKVGKNDLLICLGDVGDIEIARRLRGYKVLIAGNHDTGMSNYKDVFDEVYSGPLMISEKIILSHEPVSVPWAMNIHGHVHWPGATGNATHFNVCPDARKSFEPINFNQLIKNGIASHVETIHRLTIDQATLNSLKRRK